MENRELSWRERGRLWLRLGIRLVLTAAVILALIYVAPPLLSLLTPFVLALILAWLLNPVIKAIQKRLGIPRSILSLVLIFLLFAVAGGLLGVLVYSVASELVSLASNWQSIWSSMLAAGQTVGEALSGFFAHLPPEVVETVNTMASNLVVWLQGYLSLMLSNLAAGAGTFAMRVPPFAIATVIFVMASYFIVSDYPRIRFLFLDHLSKNVHGFLGDVKRTATAAFGGYVKAQLILSIGVFFILLIGFGVVGEPYAVLLAFLLAVLDFIPIVGAGTAMIPWAVVNVFTGDYRHAIEMMVIWGIIALFRRVAEPKVVGDQTGLSPILSLISIYVGMQVAGVAGMILGPVLCMVIINVSKLGVLDGVSADLHMATGDVAALLKNRVEPEENE